VGVRIACSGLVDADAGSVASAGFIVLRELLARGHEVDLYSKRSYVFPEQLMALPGFKYIDHSQPRVDRLARRSDNQFLRSLGVRVAHATFAHRIVRRMRVVDSHRHYDVQLSLGQWAYARSIRRPVVSWVQGPPGTDSRSVVRHRHVIKQLCGVREYARLRGYSFYRATVGRPPFRHTDFAICGSRWSQDYLVSHYGTGTATTYSIPYPIDLEAFTPSGDVHSDGTLSIVWVGRIIPRKRLDLFLDANAQLISQGRDIHLTVVGGFPFADGFRQLLDAFRYPERLTYVASMSRDRVRELLQTATVLVQPSEEEDFGSSVAEALACGTPVVVGPTNGTGDYIGEGGVRFAQYRAEDVAAAVCEVLDRLEANPNLSRARARSAAIRYFSVAHVVDQLEAIFDEALGV
jgi:glycosyltransferase involved in cell wall biosynthesis